MDFSGSTSGADASGFNPLFVQVARVVIAKLALAGA